MNLEDKNKKYDVLNLQELNEENKYGYVEIYSNSFSDMHHGTLTDIDTVNVLLEKRCSDNKLECC